MQLDEARIAICERSWTELLDLALHVARRYGVPIAACTLLTIVPAAILNHLLVFGSHGLHAGDETDGDLMFPLLLLVVLEAPLVTAPITVFLGRALFEEKPQPKAVALDCVRSLPQLILLQGIMRSLLLAPIVTAFIPFGWFPYLSEVILLERNPLRSRGGHVSTLKRNSLLHRNNSGEFLARAVGAACLSAVLIAALVGSIETVWGFLLGTPTNDFRIFVQVQFAAWIVAIYFTVARFSAYLDQRIRGEGWEVDLLLRAQRERLLR